MVLTGKQAHDKLVEAEKLIKEVHGANVVDCNNDYILLIAVTSGSIRYYGQELDTIYHDLYETRTHHKIEDI